MKNHALRTRGDIKNTLWMLIRIGKRACTASLSPGHWPPSLNLLPCGHLLWLCHCHWTLTSSADQGTKHSWALPATQAFCETHASQPSELMAFIYVLKVPGASAKAFPNFWVKQNFQLIISGGRNSERQRGLLQGVGIFLGKVVSRL